MLFDTEIEVELSTRNKSVIVALSCEYALNNDGVGVYEFGSERGVDRGNDYIELENIDWDRTGFNAMEISEVETAIKNNYTELYAGIYKQLIAAQENAVIDRYVTEKETWNFD